jgi:hypothetical protein
MLFAEVRLIIIPNLAKNPAIGGIPAIEKRKMQKLKASAMFHFEKYDQFTINFRAAPFVVEFSIKAKAAALVKV